MARRPDVTNQRRDGRIGRSRASFGDPLPVTQRTQFIQRETPRVESDRAGLEGLNHAFSGFFGSAMRASDGLTRAEHAQDLARIEQENEAQAGEGARDAIVRALSGEDFNVEDVEARQDMDYVTAYTKTFARQTGVDLAVRFQNDLAQLGSDEDVDAFTEQWVRNELRNGEQVGVGDPLFDTEVLGTFSKLTTEARANHKLNGVKVQMMKGRQALGAEIAGMLSQSETADVNDWQERASLLFPGEEYKAASFVMSSMMEAAGTNPERIGKVSTLLEESGFYDKFPQMRNEIEQKLVARYNSGQTVAGNAAYEDIGKRVMGLGQIADPVAAMEEANGIITDLVTTRDRYGKGAQFDTLLKGAMDVVEDGVQQVATFNAMNGMATKSIPLDQSLIRKNAKAYFKAAGIDPFKSPEHARAAAELVTRWSYTIDADTKAEMSAAVNGESPERFAAAIAFYDAIQQNGGDAAIGNTIDANARPTYEYAKRQVMYARRDPEEVWTDIRNGKVDHKVVTSTSWGDLVPDADSVAKAEQVVQEKILSSLEEAIPGLTSVSPYVANDIMAMAKRHHLMRNKGQTSIDDTIKDVVKAVLPSLNAFPGPNGSVLVEPIQMPLTVNERDDRGFPLIGEDGAPATRAVVPFGQQVINPATGKPEDTIATYGRDMADLVTALGGTVEGLDDQSGMAYGLDGNTAWAKDGVWIVNSGAGTPAYFSLGSTFKIGGQEVTIPEDMEEAQEMIASIDWKSASGNPRLGEQPGGDFSERFRLIPYMDGFILGYTPGFTGRLPTKEERRQAWENDKPKPQTESDERIPGFFPPQERIRPGSIWDRANQMRNDNSD